MKLIVRGHFTEAASLSVLGWSSFPVRGIYVRLFMSNILVDFPRYSFHFFFFKCTLWCLRTTSEVWNCFIVFERRATSQLLHSNTIYPRKTTSTVQNNPPLSRAHPVLVAVSNITFWFNFPRAHLSASGTEQMWGLKGRIWAEVTPPTPRTRGCGRRAVGQGPTSLEDPVSSFLSPKAIFQIGLFKSNVCENRNGKTHLRGSWLKY